MRSTQSKRRVESTTMPTIQRRAIRIALLMCGFASAGQAQELPGVSRLYAGVGFELSAQNGGDRFPTDPDQPNARVGGAAFGMGIDVGYRFSKRHGIAVEGSLPTRFQSIQEIHYLENIRYDNRHRESALSALMVMHTGAHVVRPEWLLGLSWVNEDTLVRTATAPFGSTLFGPFSSASDIQRDTWALTGGINLTAQLARHLQLVQQVRLQWVSRADFSARNDFSSANLYLSPIVFRTAVGFRLVR